MRPELLAPAGSPEALRAAVQNGADAVYLGWGAFNARRGAKNFSDEEFAAALAYCHERGVRVFLTLNTLVTDRELPQALETAVQAGRLGVDAVLVQDWGLFGLLRRTLPDLPLHASTQMSLFTSGGAREIAADGCERVVIARECSAEDTRTICENCPVEVEVFAHGALCMCYSGQCGMSALIGGRSGNRGRCAQPCRWKYGLTESKRPGQVFDITEDARGTYIFNSRDMCMIDHLPELLAAGITSLKIEGRTKSAYYVGAVTNAYRHALDDAVAGRPLDPVWQREVLQISHRPYSTGFYFGQPGQYTANSAYFAGAEVCAVVEGTAPDGRAVLTQRNKFAVGDTLELVTNAAPPVTFTAQDLCDADGLPLESVPHPMQRFTMPLPCRAAPLSLVRRKLPAETVDIRLECGKI